MKTTQILFGYEIAAQARRLSPHTLADYQNTFRKFSAWLVGQGDPEFHHITPDHIRRFLAAQNGISKKTLLNYHTGLSALWTWAVGEGITATNIVHRVERPTPEKIAIVPLTESDLKALLSVLGSSRSYTRPGKRESAHALPNADRDRAIILLLLDTGIRSHELAALRIHQVDLPNRRVKVFGKGAKERSIPFSARTGQTLWRYLSSRPNDSAGDPLIITQTGARFTRDRLYHLLESIGQRAGVPQSNPHRFRHTFAITYLRNGGDPYSLQIMLGHSTMEMVRRYLAIAQADLDAQHKIASPVAGWKL